MEPETRTSVPFGLSLSKPPRVLSLSKGLSLSKPSSRTAATLRQGAFDKLDPLRRANGSFMGPWMALQATDVSSSLL